MNVLSAERKIMVNMLILKIKTIRGTELIYPFACANGCKFPGILPHLPDGPEGDKAVQ
jgi:hypothetical protein